MNSKKSYNTKQKDLIISCLRENMNRLLTVEMIVDNLKAKGNPVGQTTVYRNLDSLVNSGIVFKFIEPHSLCAYYQYLDRPEDCANHFHLVCVDCRQMIHLNFNHIDLLVNHIQKVCGFSLDNIKTILYGRCENCIAK